MMPMIDVDNQNLLTLLINYYNAKYFFEHLGRTKIDRTRKGFHITIYVDLDPATVLTVRASFKDIDEQRLYYDYIRYSYGKIYLMSILYNSKGGYLKDEDINPLHLPWKNSRIPAKYVGLV